MAEKEIVYSDNIKAIVNALKNNEEGLTLNELKEVTGLPLVPGHIVDAMKKGLIVTAGKKEVMRPAKTARTVYFYIDNELRTNAKGEAFTHTEGETAILKAAATIEGDFTLEDLASVMGVEKVAPGSINSLVTKKGNIGKRDEKKIFIISKPDSVNVYALADNIPNIE